MEGKKAALRRPSLTSRPVLNLSQASWSQACKGASVKLMFVNMAGRVLNNATHETETDYEPGYEYEPFVEMSEESAALLYATLQDRFEPELARGRKVIGGEIVRSVLPGKPGSEPMTDGERAAVNVALKAKDDHIADLRRHIAYITQTTEACGPASINIEHLLGPGEPATRNSGNF